MKRKLISIICIIGIWQVMAGIIQKEVILPLPLYVWKRMFELASTPVFYEAIIASLSRILVSFLIAFIIGTLLGIISGLKETIQSYLQPVITILQTIPQIAYILILLVWFDSVEALIMIIILMLLPIFYYNALEGIQNMKSEYFDIIQIYDQSFFYLLWHVYIPLMKGYLISAIQTCIPLSLKVGVMAEVFVSSHQGIGKQLYFARIQIDMISIFAWVLWMIVIIMVIQMIVKRMMR